MEDLVQQYAEEHGGDAEFIQKRWKGKPEVMIEDLFRVRDSETREVRDLKLFPYQKKAVRAYFYGNSSTITVYKGRRIGMTFIFELCMAVDALRYPNTVFPIIAQSGEDSKKRIKDLVEIFENSRLDIDIEGNGGKIIANKLILPNGSRFESFTAGANSGRGDDPARATLMDEMAFFPDQEDTLAAFSASTVLGHNQKEIRVSTPEMLGDRFMESFNNGTRTGFSDENGNEVKKDHPDARPCPISIKQPSIENPDDVDIKKSLYDQDVKPVRPDMNLQKLEEDRMSDPQKFAQEYLCRPISDEYRFFSQAPIKRAQERGRDGNYRHGSHFQTTNPKNRMVMSVDVAFGGNDDTAMMVWEHVHGTNSRNMRHFEFIRPEQLEECPDILDEPELKNPEHQAKRICQVAQQMDVDHIVYDETGNKFFKQTLRKYTGRGLHPFNFSDTEAVLEMAESLNYGLHNDDVTLLPDKDIRQQMLAIVKQQKEDYNRPKLTGKDKSPSGTDDAAMAAILGAYPSMLSDDAGGKKLRAVEDETDTSQRSANNGRRMFGSVKGQNFGGDETSYRAPRTTGVNRGRKYLSRHRT